MATQKNDAPRLALVIDDAPFVRAMVVSMLEELGFETVSASSVNGGIEALLANDPDLAVIDLDLGGDGPTGIDVVRFAQERMPWTAIVVLTDFRAPQLVDTSATDLDAVYLVKSDIESVDQLRHGIEAAMRGEPLNTSRSQEPHISITPAQSEVLRLMARGLTNAEIAQKSGMSHRSVERLTIRLYRALGIAEDEGNARVRAVNMYRSSQIDAVGRRSP